MGSTGKHDDGDLPRIVAAAVYFYDSSTLKSEPKGADASARDLVNFKGRARY
jgi:hypothetical protein